MSNHSQIIILTSSINGLKFSILLLEAYDLRTGQLLLTDKKELSDIKPGNTTYIPEFVSNTLYSYKDSMVYMEPRVAGNMLSNIDNNSYDPIIDDAILNLKRNRHRILKMSALLYDEFNNKLRRHQEPKLGYTKDSYALLHVQHSHKPDYINLYTDGSAYEHNNNPESNCYYGYGFVLTGLDGEVLALGSKSYKTTQRKGPSLSSIAEVEGVLFALGTAIELYGDSINDINMLTDSEETIKLLSGYAKNWSYGTISRYLIDNDDYTTNTIQRGLGYLKDKYDDTKFDQLKGHSGHAFNEACDWMAGTSCRYLYEVNEGNAKSIVDDQYTDLINKLFEEYNMHKSDTLFVYSDGYIEDHIIAISAAYLLTGWGSRGKRRRSHNRHHRIINAMHNLYNQHQCEQMIMYIMRSVAIMPWNVRGDTYNNVGEVINALSVSHEQLV